MLAVLGTVWKHTVLFCDCDLLTFEKKIFSREKKRQGYKSGGGEKTATGDKPLQQIFWPHYWPLKKFSY